MSAWEGSEQQQVDFEERRRREVAEAKIAENEALKARLRGARQASPKVTLDGGDLDRLEKVVDVYGGGLLAIMENGKVAVMLPGVLQGLPALIELARAGLGVTSPASAVQEWGAGPGQRPVPYESDRACAESKAVRDAYDRASAQAARAGHPDPHGAALVVLLSAKAEARGST